MPNLETFHGDEEAIEACSAVWFEILDEHHMGMGEIDPVSSQGIVAQTYSRLLEQYSSQEVAMGHEDAIETLKQRDLFLSYNNPRWPYGEA